MSEDLFFNEFLEVASSLNGLANVYYKQGKYGEAEPLYQRALRIREQQLGSEHPLIAYPLDGLGNLYVKQGRYEEAEPLYQRALRIREQQVGPEHPLVAYPLNNLANRRGQPTNFSLIETIEILLTDIARVLPDLMRILG